MGSEDRSPFITISLAFSFSLAQGQTRRALIGYSSEHYQSALKVLPKKPYVDIKGISSMIEFMAESDPLVSKMKPEEGVNHSLLKKLDDSGFLDQLYKK